MTLNITANYIEQWSNERDSQKLLPVLIRRLIKETLPRGSIIEIDFPGYENVGRTGFDGRLSSSASAFCIPQGQSVWEVGTSKNPQQKAKDDFENRKKDAKPDEDYVFVSSRNWNGKVVWLKGARENNPGWKSINALDANDLEQWLEMCPYTTAWFAGQIGKPFDYLEPADQFLDNWLSATDPHFPKQVLLQDRDKQKTRLIDTIAKPGQSMRVVADTRKEAIAFVCAALDQDEIIDYPVIVLKDKEANIEIAKWQDAGNSPKILIAKSKEISLDFPPNMLSGNTLIVAGVREDFPNYEDDEKVGGMITLPRISNFDAIFTEHNDSRYHYRQTGGSLSALHRNQQEIASNREPAWRCHLSEDNFIWLALVGCWDEAYNADKAFLTTLTGSKNYNSWRNSLRDLSKVEDAPLEKTSGDERGYKLFSRLDAFLSVVGMIEGDHIKKFLDESAEILSEPDPNDKPDEDTRYSLHEKREYSDFIRTGIVEGLILLNLKKGTLGCGDITSKIKAFYDKIFTHDRAWISLNDVLPMLAEASPDDFLAQLKKALDKKPNEIQCLFEAKPGIFHKQYTHPSLLWALEVLAWKPERLKEVAMLFCHLQKHFESFIEDNYGNRPSGSLRSIFRSWSPQTSASVKDRLEVLESLYAKYPTEVIKLAQKLASQHDKTGDYTASPVWREDALNLGRVKIKDRNEIIKFLVDLLERHLVNAEMPLEERFDVAAYAIREFLWWGEEHANQFFEKIIVMLKNTDMLECEESVLRFRESLRSHLERSYLMASKYHEHKKIIKMVHEILAETEMENEVLKNFYLFASWPRIGKYFEGDDSLDKKEKYIAEEKKRAIHDIWGQLGIDGIIDLAERAENQAMVSDALYEHIISKGSFPLQEYLIRFLMREDVELHKIHNHLSFIFGRIKGDEHVPEPMPTHEVIKLIEDIKSGHADDILNWEDKEIALYHAIRIDEKEGRDYIDNLPDDIQQKYFSRYRISRGNEMRREDGAESFPDENEWIAQKYLEYKRPRLGWQVFRVREYIPFESQIQLLEAMAIEGRDEGGEKDAFPEGWYIQDFLNEAHDKKLDDETKIRVARMEYKFYSYLRDSKEDDRISFINWWIGKDPAFYIQLHKYVYKTDSGDDDASRNLDENSKQTNAQLSWKILLGLSLGTQNFPWIKEDRQIEEDALLKWIEDVRKLAKEANRSRIVDNSIGQGLGHIVQKEKGVKPEESICNILEKIQSEVIFNSFAMGRFNSRGVLCGDQDDRGYTTANLVEEYEKASRELEEGGYPFVAKLMKHMALRYREEVEENKARNERNNLDWR